MTAAHLTVAHCGEVSALTLGLPASAAIPEQKGTLPKGLFVAKAPVSSKLKQRLVNDIASITMLALLRPANTAMGAGSGKMPEVLVIGLRVNTPGIPVEVIDLIAGQRKSGIVFVCVRNVEFEGAMREEACFVVRRPLSERSGHAPTFHEFASAWIPSGEALLEIADAAATTDDLWDSLCSQVIFGSTDFADLDARIVRASRIAQLRTQIAKLEGDHARAKTQERRNEAHAKLRKARAQLESLEQL